MEINGGVLVEEVFKPIEKKEENVTKYDKSYVLSDSSILNKPDHHHTAAVAHRLCYTEHLDYNKEKKEVERSYAEITGSVWISDCNRSINLNFDIFDQTDDYNNPNGGLDEEENSLYKIDQLINQLVIFKSNLTKMVNDRREFKKRIKEDFNYEYNSKLKSDYDTFKESLS